jgi:hypothetical protein
MYDTVYACGIQVGAAEQNVTKAVTGLKDMSFITKLSDCNVAKFGCLGTTKQMKISYTERCRKN